MSASQARVWVFNQEQLDRALEAWLASPEATVSAELFSREALVMAVRDFLASDAAVAAGLSMEVMS